jgi:hypothetical protein
MNYLQNTASRFSIRTIVLFGEISGSHVGEYEDDSLLGCCAV